LLYRPHQPWYSFLELHRHPPGYCWRASQ